MSDLVHDTRNRPLRSLRISVTDRCNLRCAYCMPEEEYTWLPKSDILSFEEIGRLVDVFGELGVTKVRLTGGEPLLRRGLPALLRMLADKGTVQDLALTTNGLLLADHAATLAEAGLHRVTISLDTLRADRFRKIARYGKLPAVLRGIEAAALTWPGAVKLDTVVHRGDNDDELIDLLEYAREVGAELRFIEYMDVGGATRWAVDRVVSRKEMLARIAERLGEPTPVEETTWAPADRYRLPDGTVFGIISSTTQPFCGTCDRARLTADGVFYTCLYAWRGLDLRAPLRDGHTDEQLNGLLRRTWSLRDDRGAERRLEDERRGRLHSPAELRDRPHLEMHTRGG